MYMKPKGVTTQIKALVEYFLMVVFTMLLNRLFFFFFQFLCLIWTEKHGSERVRSGYLGFKGFPLDSKPTGQTQEAGCLLPTNLETLVTKA